MRIISGVKDYYDVVVSQGIDKSILYVRTRVEQKVNSILHLNIPQTSDGHNYQRDDQYCRYIYLGFCGQIYPVIEFVNAKEGTRNFYYNLKDLKIEMDRVGFKTQKEKRFWSSRFDPHYLKNSESFFNADTSGLLNKFHEFNAPIFVLFSISRDQFIVSNISLKDYQFAKVKDPYACFQDISTYVSGVLKTPDRPMVELKDKDKIDKHGFDKYSFRKLPTKK